MFDGCQIGCQDCYGYDLRCGDIVEVYGDYIGQIQYNNIICAFVIKVTCNRSFRFEALIAANISARINTPYNRELYERAVS